MSGLMVSRALQNRFESIRQNEIDRLHRKLRALPDDQRQTIEAITVDIIRALARGADRSLMQDMPEPALDALVRLFALDGEVAESR